MRHTLIKCLFVLLAFCVSGKVLAQIPPPSFEVEPTIEYTSKKKELLEQMLFSDETGHYALFAAGRFGGGQKSIRKFTSDFQPTDFKIDLNFRKKVYMPETLKVLALGGKIFHIWNAKTKEGIDYYAQEIDVKSQAIVSEKLIARIPQEETLFNYTRSKIVIDSSLKRVLLYVQLNSNIKDKKRIRFYIYDENLEQLRTENYQLPYANNQFSIANVMPYKDDEIILVGKSYHSDNHIKSSRKKEYNHVIYSLEDNQAQLLKNISPEAQHLNRIFSKIKDDNLIVMGLVANQIISKPSSLYFLNYNLNTSKIDNETKSRLPDSFYEYPEERDEKVGTISIGKVSRKKYADFSYFSRRLILNAKNEAILIAEQNYSVNYNSSVLNLQTLLSPGMSGSSHYSNDIAVFKMNYSGELIWTTKVKKRQKWDGTVNHLSFYSAYKNDKLFLFYNGNYTDIESSRHLLGAQDAALLCTIVESDGDFQRNVITYYTEEYPNVSIPSLGSYSKKIGVLLFGRAPGNVKRLKMTQVRIN